MDLIAKLYAIGSVVIGAVLIADNVILIRRRGDLATTPEGKAVGWTFVFMIAEMSWAGASVMVLLKGYVPALLPVFYLSCVAVALSAGVITNLIKGPVHSLHLWYVKGMLALSVIFTMVAVFEVVYARAL